MAKRKPHIITRSAEPQNAWAGPSVRVAVPRARRIIPMIMLVVPWLVAGAIYVRSHDAGTVVKVPNPVFESSSGPWGDLIKAPIIISPPLEYVPRNWGPLEPTYWHVAVATHDELAARLASTGMGQDAVGRLRATARLHPEAGGMVMRPDSDLLRGLDPEVRARLYLEVMSELNVDQRIAFRFFGESPSEWLGWSVSPRTRELVAPLIYRHDGFMYFADIQSVRAQIEDAEELQRLAKVLYRQATILASLRIDDASEVPAVAEYRGRGGRRTDIRPLLESIAEAGDSRPIDISHLLPPFARQHLYRYPRITVAEHERPLLANCLWTALNFFSEVPDDRLLDPQVALEQLKRDYYVVHHGYQLGDIVAFADRGGNLFHVAVFIADDLIFGKNGTTPMAPWSILPIEHVKGHYVYESKDDWQVTFHRRKDM